MKSIEPDHFKIIFHKRDQALQAQPNGARIKSTISEAQKIEALQEIVQSVRHMATRKTVYSRA